MKNLIYKTFYGLLVLLCIFTLGIFLPMLVSLLLIIYTDTTYNTCLLSVQFWIFTIVGWCISTAYVNQIIKE